MLTIPSLVMLMLYDPNDFYSAEKFVSELSSDDLTEVVQDDTGTLHILFGDDLGLRVKPGDYLGVDDGGHILIVACEHVEDVVLKAVFPASGTYERVHNA